MEKIDVIIQARVGSSRLNRKVLADICGKPLLQHVIERAKRSALASDVVVATTAAAEDEEILKLADSCGVRSYAGPTDDVLRRYYEAASEGKADAVVRLTGDCPLVHPPTIDAMIALLQSKKVDYVCPDPRYRSLETGLEVFTVDALRQMDERAEKDYQREHVTLYLRENPEDFKIALYIPEKIFQRTDIRITVDYSQDLKFIRELYKQFYHEGEIVDLKRVVAFLEQHPELRKMNIDAKLSQANQLSISDSISEKIIRSAEGKI